MSASTTQTEPGRSTSFFASLPGVLTAVAAVITAVGGIYGVWWTSRPDPPVPVPTPVHTAAPTPAPTPAPSPTETSDADLRLLLDALLALEGASTTAEETSESELALADWYVETDDSGRLAVEQCAAGDAAACEQTWYVLLDECGTYGAAACDVVYWLSPLGSEEESFAATCGGLLADHSAAGRCA